MLQQASSAESKKDIKTRQHLMERSFAQATRYGYQRARWRRLWRVEIQEYLTAAIQNIKILIKDAKASAPAMQMRVAAQVRGRPDKLLPCPRPNLFNLQWGIIAGVCRTVKENFARHRSEIIACSGK
jgi:hypothetical protein